MGEIREHRNVMLIAALVSRFDHALEWGRAQLIERYGPVEMASTVFDFTETEFYTKSMGEDLRKQFVAFRTPFDPANIAETRIHSNRLEQEYAGSFEQDVERPLNIDPGYISEAKLVLVTTKDRDHRIYLQDGIYAEVTLHFRGGGWQAQRWTYPDYQREDFQDFFSGCRTHLRTSMLRR